MTSLTHAYPLKLPQDITLHHQLDMLREIVMHAAQKLLAELWSDHWIDTLAAKHKQKNKAYKVINEQRVSLTIPPGRVVYLPSRIRRCIAELVGRILRSQFIRKQCYYDVLRIVQITGVAGNLDKLVRTVALTLANFDGKYYRWALIRQTLRMFRRYYYQLGLDLRLLQQFPYSTVITPRIQSFAFPYSPDEGQAIRYDWHEDLHSISIQMKVPCRPHPIQRSHWVWQEFILPIPGKIQPRITSPNSKLRAPTLRYITLKGGLTLPFLECA